MRLKPQEILFLFLLYALSVAIRLVPRLSIDPFLLTFDADIWYRLCLAQFVVDNGHIPVWDIRYSAYGQVPFWYNPGALHIYAFLNKITSLELPVVVSRVMPFVESFAILPFYFLGRYLYSIRVAIVASLFLALTPAFIFWSSIGTPQGFTMFCIPLGILLWVTFLQEKYLLKNKWLHFAAFALLLTINFLTHLTYFNHIIILLFIHVAVVNEKQGKFKNIFFLLLAMGISQLLTAWWWLPGKLYWWWTQGLSTSTASPDRLVFLKHYGALSAIIGHIAFFFLVYFIFKRWHKKEVFYLIPVYWAIYPIIESHMEGILMLFQRNDLTWNNLVRPIEGFRFYSFLAQPLALCAALMFEQIFKSKFVTNRGWDIKKLCVGLCIVLFVTLNVDLYKGFQINKRYKSHMVTLDDIHAAKWFRTNTPTDARMLADYYTAQMFSGICTGKALLGSMFPLKGANIPYISDSWRVLDDIYKVYKLDDPNQVLTIIKKYNVSHVVYSDHILRKIEFVINGYGDMEGFYAGKYDNLKDIDHKKTLLNPKLFDIVYEKGDVKILAVK